MARRFCQSPKSSLSTIPPEKPRIVGYAAKWHEDSFECRNTVRRFVDPVREAPLCAALGAVALKCWQVFQLRGYARVDFRVDADGTAVGAGGQCQSVHFT